MAATVTVSAMVRWSLFVVISLAIDLAAGTFRSCWSLACSGVACYSACSIGSDAILVQL